MRREFFNGLVGFLLLLEAGIESNPGPFQGQQSNGGETDLQVSILFNLGIAFLASV